MPNKDAHPATTPINLILDSYTRAELLMRPLR
ncbi:hypothetical protein SAMN04487783_2423 [Agrococcus baldri]|uniref:Uncharacterized protein n=1 Tax=Agrococcus baldri TaxID=153730 RepID=A0AA94HP56_9MICO|nr:hypothetical protein SAMN04487783_2423 [Agrococcus baldri]